MSDIRNEAYAQGLSRLIQAETISTRVQPDKTKFYAFQDLLRQMFSMFCTSIDDMSTEEKRAAIRTVVRKVIWDGVNAHVVLFGADEDEIEFPDMDDRLGHIYDEDGEEEPLGAFVDIDYDDFEQGNSAQEKNKPSTASKSRWREDGK